MRVRVGAMVRVGLGMCMCICDARPLHDVVRVRVPMCVCISICMYACSIKSKKSASKLLMAVGSLTSRTS